MKRRSVKYGSGFKRLAICLAVTLALLFGLFVIGDNYIVSRRKHLLTVEIIIYIVIANAISFVLIWGVYRMARWISRGFKGVPTDQVEE